MENPIDTLDREKIKGLIDLTLHLSGMEPEDRLAEIYPQTEAHAIAHALLALCRHFLSPQTLSIWGEVGGSFPPTPAIVAELLTQSQFVSMQTGFLLGALYQLPEKAYGDAVEAAQGELRRSAPRLVPVRDRVKKELLRYLFLNWEAQEAHGMLSLPWLKCLAHVYRQYEEHGMRALLLFQQMAKMGDTPEMIERNLERALR